MPAAKGSARTNFNLWFFLLLTVILPLIYVSQLLQPVSLPKFSWLTFVTLILTFVWLYQLLFNRQTTLLLPSPALLWLSFLALLLLSTLFSWRFEASFWGEYGWYQGLLTFFYSFLIWLFASQLNQEGRLTLLKVFVILGVTLSLFSILQFFSATMGFGNYKIYPGSGVHTTMGTPIYFGGFLILTTFSTLLLAFQNISKKQLLAGFALLFVLQLVALFLTQSRSAWLGLAFGLVLLFSLYPTKNLKTKILTPFALFLVAIPIFVITMPAEEASLASRLTMWRSSLLIIKDFPLLGTGPNTFQLAYPRYALVGAENLMSPLYSQSPHNEVLHQAATVGLIPLLFYLAIFTYFFLKGHQATKKGSQEVAFFIGLLGGYFLFLQFSFTEIGSTPLFWLLIGLAATELSQPKKRVKELRLSNLKNVWKVSFILASLAILAWPWFKGSFILPTADAYAGRANHQMQRRDFMKASSAIDAALNLTPTNHTYQALKAQIEERWFDETGIGLHYNLAEQAYLKLLSINPYDVYSLLRPAVFYLKYGEIYQQKDLLEKAASFFKELIKVEPNYSQNYYNLGLCYFYLSNYEEATVAWEATIKLNPQEGDALFLLGQAQLRLGQKKKAAEYFAQAAALPNYPRASEAQRLLNQLKEELDERKP
jgi:tetratricopeptide (TPR) repeat protein